MPAHRLPLTRIAPLMWLGLSLALFISGSLPLAAQEPAVSYSGSWRYIECGRPSGYDMPNFKGTIRHYMKFLPGGGATWHVEYRPRDGDGEGVALTRTPTGLVRAESSGLDDLFKVQILGPTRMTWTNTKGFTWEFKKCSTNNCAGADPALTCSSAR